MQTAFETMTEPNWSKEVSEENARVDQKSPSLKKNDRQFISRHEESFSDDDETSDPGQKPSVTKYCPVRTGDVPEDLSDDVLSELRGVRYVHKRSMSENTLIFILIYLIFQFKYIFT